MIIIIHYHEIALKGRNRAFFEKALCQNISKTLQQTNFRFKIQRLPGRIVIFPENIDVGKDLSAKREIESILRRTFGIKYFAFGFACDIDMENAKRLSLEFFGNRRFKSFKIEARRAEKNYPFTSKDLENEIGDFIRLKTKTPVDLDNPEKIIFLEAAQKKIFLYSEKLSGPGGLPCGVSGKVVSLISSGLDSPVASWYLLKRGCQVVFLHFYSAPYIPASSKESVKENVKALKSYFPDSLKLIIFPFGDLQRYIAPRVPPKFRTIIYRRVMMIVASQICKEEKAEAISTGESVGQVASQTLENMNVIDNTAEFQVLRPLAGFDKEEIIQKAKEIGTYEISIRGGADCCTLFMPSFPATKSRLEDIIKAEKNIGNLKNLIKKSFKDIEIFNI